MARIMIASENTCAQSINTKYPWSNNLKEAGLKFRFWDLKVRQIRELSVSDPQITFLQQYLNILDILTTLEEVRETRKQAKKEYKNIIKTARELQQKELETNI